MTILSYRSLRLVACLLSMAFFISGCEGCKDPVDEALNEALDFSGIYENSDGWEVELKLENETGSADFTRVPAQSGITWREVGDPFMMSMIHQEDGSWRGSARMKDMSYLTLSDVRFSGNTMTVTPTDGSEGHTFTKSTGSGTGTGTGTGTASPYKGIWVRQKGASGDETDVAIGTVPGAPANAVWMCEWKGTVGLYKGTISGDQITFDPQYGLPTYTVKLENGELMLKGNVSQSLFTPYKKGTWNGNCGKLGN